MQIKANLKNILLSMLIVTGLVIGGYFIYNIDTENRDQSNIESVNKIEDIKVRDKKVDNEIDSRDIEDRNNTIAKESKEERDERIERIASNVRGEYRGIVRNPQRYNPIEVYTPPITNNNNNNNNNNNPIELPSIPNNPSVPAIPNVPNIPIIPNPPVIPPDNGNGTDNPTDPGDNNGGGTNTPILLAGDRDPSFDTGLQLGLKDGTYDNSFSSPSFSDFGYSVNTIAIQSDGKILAGGSFTGYLWGGVSNRIIRLNSDGSIDDNFNTGIGFNDTVNSIVLQSDGKILIGGDFTTYQGISVNRIVRLNSDGSLDVSFNMGSGFNNWVNTLILQSDGKILVGGGFTTYQGVLANRIIHLNNDGNIDDSFNTGIGFNDTVDTIVLQSDGKILAGGSFTSYQGESANKIVRLNIGGDRDFSFNIVTGFNDTVLTILQQSDGKILVGGSFTTYQGVLANRIVRLNSDGGRDISFNTGTEFNSTVRTILQQSDGKILVGGSFTKYQGPIILFEYIVRLDNTGSLDASFDLPAPVTSTVYTLAIQTDGKILVGADRSRITRLNNGFIEGGFDDWVYDVAIQPDGKIIVGGEFTKYKDSYSNRIIRLNTDGSRDADFDIGTGFNNYIETIIIQSDGKIIVGGSFTTYQGISTNRIVRLNSDGSRDYSFNIGTGFNGFVGITAIQSDGKVIVGGGFTTYQGVLANRIVRLNSDGSRDMSFDLSSGFNDWVNTLILQSDGKILIGGDFTTYQGISANRIVRLNSDGSRDDSFNIGTGFDWWVFTLAIQNDGKILAGGDFTSYDGNTVGRIIRLNPDGQIDMTFDYSENLTVSDTNEEWSGEISQVSVYNRALSTEEVQQNFNAYSYRYDLSEEQSEANKVNTGLITYLDAGNVLSYPGNGDIWYDLSGNNNNAKLYNGVTHNNESGGSWNFDGSDDVGVIQFNGEQSLTNLTYNVWVKPDTELDSYRTILDLDGDDNFFMGIYDTEFISYSPSYDSGYILEPNQWYNLAVTYSDENGVKFYVNGEEVYADSELDGDEFSFNTIGIGAGFDLDSEIGFNYTVYDIKVQGDGKILVAGAFDNYPYITRLNSDGIRDTSFNSGNGFNDYVYTLAIQNDGKILVGGRFNNYKEQPAIYLIRIHN